MKIGGQRMWLWRTVDDEGVVLDVLVQKRRDARAAIKLVRRLLKNQGFHPEIAVVDGGVGGQVALSRALTLEALLLPLAASDHRMAVLHAVVLSQASRPVPMREAQLAERRAQEAKPSVVTTRDTSETSSACLTAPFKNAADHCKYAAIWSSPAATPKLAPNPAAWVGQKSTTPSGKLPLCSQ